VDHIIVLGETHLRRILKSYADYYNGISTHRSLNKDASVSRPVQRTGVISSRAILGDFITATPAFKLSVHTGCWAGSSSVTPKPACFRAAKRSRHPTVRGTGWMQYRSHVREREIELARRNPLPRVSCSVAVMTVAEAPSAPTTDDASPAPGFEFA
jgi:hypothetical protein